MTDDSPWTKGMGDDGDEGPKDLGATFVENTLYGPDLNVLDGEFIGDRGRVFGLALKTGLLTVLTLGFYRFWMKTRLRRWYWSGVRVGGAPAEYTGDPLEKLLGFLIAVAFLAFYIGIVNLLLMFVSFSLFEGNFAAYALSFAGVVPLWFYARYRARRYVLARTRWRGIRFGLEPGAWGYAWRALVHWAVTILTGGLLWPRMTFWLEKYRTDRTWYGDVRLEQEGKWTMLYTATKHVFLAAVVAGIAAILLWADNIWGISVAFVAVIWGGFGLAYYKVKTWELLTNAKRAGGIVFHARPKPLRVFWIYVLGYGLSSFVVTIFLVPIGFMLLALMGGVEALASGGAANLTSLSSWALTAVSIGSYFAIFLAWGAVAHAFVTMPLWRHYSETLTVIDPQALHLVQQRGRDSFEEAEGFAEALDVGAAI